MRFCCPTPPSAMDRKKPEMAGATCLLASAGATLW